jgi:hypothetical protein
MLGCCRFDMPRELLYIRNALQQVLEAIWQEPRVVYHQFYFGVYLKVVC